MLKHKKEILVSKLLHFFLSIRIAPGVYLWGKTMNNGKPKHTSQGAGAMPVPRHQIHSGILVKSSCSEYT